MTADAWAVDILMKILLAMLLGGLIGWQREVTHKPAGLRTHILIVLGATVVMCASRYAAETMGGDPTRIAANVIVGIGFIGAGTIMKEGPTIYGLTSAATIWVDGALGTVIGAGYYSASVILTGATIIVLTVFNKLESVARGKGIARQYMVVTSEPERTLSLIREATGGFKTANGFPDMRYEAGRLSMTFTMSQTQARHEALTQSLRLVSEVVEIKAL